MKLTRAQTVEDNSLSAVSSKIVKASQVEGSASIEEMLEGQKDQARLRKQVALKLQVTGMYKTKSDDKNTYKKTSALHDDKPGASQGHD